MRDRFDDEENLNEDRVLDEIFDEEDLDGFEEESDYYQEESYQEENYYEEENHVNDKPSKSKKVKWKDVTLAKNNEPSKPKKNKPIKSSTNKHNKSGRNKSFYLKVLASSLAGCVLIFSLMLSNKLELFSEGKVGKEAVMLLYNFNNINELANNLKDLKGMMTTKCYYKTTVLNSDKSLNTYLKFQKKSTKVNIIESKPGFVLYSLTNENITESRLFIFSYKLNLFGDICEVREFEAIDFYSEVQSVSDEELDKLIEQWESEGEPSSDEEDDSSNYNDEPYLDEAGLRETQSTEESNE